jgi:hypothetical protein
MSKKTAEISQKRPCGICTVVVNTRDLRSLFIQISAITHGHVFGVCDSCTLSPSHSRPQIIRTWVLSGCRALFPARRSRSINRDAVMPQAGISFHASCLTYGSGSHCTVSNQGLSKRVLSRQYFRILGCIQFSEPYTEYCSVITVEFDFPAELLGKSTDEIKPKGLRISDLYVFRKTYSIIGYG